MNSFHMFSRMMVVVTVLVGGNVFGGDKSKLFTVKNSKVGVHNLINSSTSSFGQAVLVQGIYKVTQSDNAATLGATSMYLVKNINGQYVIDRHDNCLVANKNASSFVGTAGKTGLYVIVDRGLRYIEGTVSEYGINQKAIIKKAEEYLPETANGVIKEVLPVVVEAGHGFVVRSVTESGAAFVAGASR